VSKSSSLSCSETSEVDSVVWLKLLKVIGIKLWKVVKVGVVVE
jgi:hypothetical protein